MGKRKSRANRAYGIVERDTREQRREDKRNSEKQSRIQLTAEEQRKYDAMTPEEKKRYRQVEEAYERIRKNGITEQDLKENYDMGYKDGRDDAIDFVMKTCYAAICLALNELHGFGATRCTRVLNLVDEKITYSITSMDTIQEACDKIGIEISFSESMPGDRISVKEDK